MKATHFIDSVIAHGALSHEFRCVAPEDAQCRRRPPDWRGRESWTEEEATETGHPCWAVEWVEAASLYDAVTGEDTVLASAPVHVSYDEGVVITPVPVVSDEAVEAGAAGVSRQGWVGGAVMMSDERLAGLRGRGWTFDAQTVRGLLDSVAYALDLVEAIRSLHDPIPVYDGAYRGCGLCLDDVGDPERYPCPQLRALTSGNPVEALHRLKYSRT